MTKREEKRAETRRANAAPLWQQRRALAKRSPVDAPVVAFDLGRKAVKRLRGADEQDQWWRYLAAVLDKFAAAVHDAESCSQSAGFCEVHSPRPGFGPELDPGARPRARESTGGHTPSAREGKEQ